VTSGHKCLTCGQWHPWPTDELDLSSLKAGDIVRNLATGQSYILHDKIDSQWFAVRTVVVSNPSEWVKA
jgi:hypothetical protein